MTRKCFDRGLAPLPHPTERHILRAPRADPGPLDALPKPVLCEGLLSPASEPGGAMVSMRTPLKVNVRRSRESGWICPVARRVVMDRARSLGFVGSACALAILAGMLLGACAPAQSSIDQAVSATRTADKVAADTLATALAGTLAAMPSATSAAPSGPAAPPPPAATPAQSSQVCPEAMADLAFLSSGYLEGGNSSSPSRNQGAARTHSRPRPIR